MARREKDIWKRGSRKEANAREVGGDGRLGAAAKSQRTRDGMSEAMRLKWILHTGPQHTSASAKREELRAALEFPCVSRLISYDIEERLKSPTDATFVYCREQPLRF